MKRRPAEILEAARRPASSLGLVLGLDQLDGDLVDEPRIAREAQHIIDPVRLAPGHQRLPAEAGVGAQQDAGPRPAPPDLGDEARHLLDGARRRVDVGVAQLGTEQVAAAENVERQVAVAVVVAVEEAAFLVTVQRIVGRIEVEHDLARRLGMRLQEHVHEQAFDGAGVMAEAMVACRRCGRRVLEPVQRRLAGERRTVGPARRKLAGQHRHDRIVAERVVVDEILVAERETEDALADQGRDAVFGTGRVATITEASREPLDQPDRTIRGAQQQRSRVRSDRSAVEIRHDGPSRDRSKRQRLCATLCRHRGFPLIRPKSLLHNNFARFEASMHQISVRNAG